MAHCGSEAAAVALAEIDVAAARDEVDIAETVLGLAETDLSECEEEHGNGS